jgi:hypothetical protein
MLQKGWATPYFIWPNLDPYRRQSSPVDAVPKPGSVVLESVAAKPSSRSTMPEAEAIVSALPRPPSAFGGSPGAHWVPKLPVIGVNSRPAVDGAHGLKSERLQAVLCDARFRGYCLPCRRSRVRIPSAASEKACICRSFSFAQSLSSSASGRTDSGLAVRRSSAASRKTPGLQADSRSSELKSFCRPAEGRVFRLLRPLAGCSCKWQSSCAWTPAGELPAIPILGGPVRFQSGYREELVCDRLRAGIRQTA